MSQIFVSGKLGSVLVGTQAYGFKDWSLSMDNKMLETSNFVSGAYRTYIGGLIGATLDLSGAYDVGPAGSGGDMPLVVGNTYSFTLGVNNTVTFTLNAIVSKVSLKQSVDDLCTVSVTCQVTGSFTSSIA